MMKTVVFSDFDGTISKRDVGYSMFHHFSNGRNDELLPDWKSGKMTTRDCLLKEAEMMAATSEELYEYLKTFEIDDGFEPFLLNCNDNKIDLNVISDGLDIYIKYILERHNLGYLNVSSNKGSIEGSKMIIEFPVENENCTRCGICKGETISNYKKKAGQETKIIFIGDGYSDICAVKEADIVFATKDLADYCRTNELEFIKFDSFHDITEWMKKNNLFEEISN